MIIVFRRNDCKSFLRIVSNLRLRTPINNDNDSDYQRIRLSRLTKKDDERIVSDADSVRVGR